VSKSSKQIIEIGSTFSILLRSPPTGTLGFPPKPAQKIVKGGSRARRATTTLCSGKNIVEFNLRSGPHPRHAVKNVVVIDRLVIDGRWRAGRPGGRSAVHGIQIEGGIGAASVGSGSGEEIVEGGGSRSEIEVERRRVRRSLGGRSHWRGFALGFEAELGGEEAIEIVHGCWDWRKGKEQRSGACGCSGRMRCREHRGK